MLVHISRSLNVDSSTALLYCLLSTVYRYEGASGMVKSCDLRFNSKGAIKLEKDAGQVQIAKDNQLKG